MVVAVRIGITVGFCALWAIAAALMWGWFIATPLGLPAIAPAEAVGIALVGWWFFVGAYGLGREADGAMLMRHLWAVAGTFGAAVALHGLLAWL